MNFRKPRIMDIDSDRAKCPVCGKASYSQSGVHPQCAVARADAALKAVRKAEALAAPVVETQVEAGRICPRCQRKLRNHRAVCDCGHKFATFVTHDARK